MRILRLITRLNVGGPARHALLLTRGLRPEYDTTLAAGRPGPNEGELGDPEVDVLRVPLVRHVHAGADLRSFVAVRRLLAATHPAIVDTHMAKAGLIGRLTALTCRPRPITVHTFHGHVLRGYFGPNTERGVVALEQRLARRTDVLIAVSAEIRDELLALGVGRPGQYEVIPLGLDLAPLLGLTGQSGALRRQFDLDADTPLVGVIGRLVAIKDHATLLDAMEEVPGAHLAVIGDGDLRRTLESAVQDKGLADRVHFTGWWKDMATAIADLDVVALTSRNEGTPSALIEAAAGAKPVVATAVGGVPSVVEDGVTGHLVPAGNSSAVAGRLRDLLADAETRQRMGAAGRERVASVYGEARLIDDIRGLYRSLLESRPRD